MSTGGRREERLVFGEVADVYDRVRPTYPRSLFEEIFDSVGEAAAVRALEVGAGTGKATVALAEGVGELVALEPSEDMAAVARRNTAPFPSVRIKVSSFEDWPVEPASFGLLCSAQAWHWVTPEVRTAKATEALAGGGLLALFWNTLSLGTDDLRTSIDRVYERRAPGLTSRGPGTGRALSLGEAADELDASTDFEDARTTEHPWVGTLGTDDYLALMSTQSDHRMLEPATLDALLSDLRALIDDAGGAIESRYVARLVTARRRPRS